MKVYFALTLLCIGNCVAKKNSEKSAEVIREVYGSGLSAAIGSADNVGILFYDKKNSKSAKIIKNLDKSFSNRIKTFPVPVSLYKIDDEAEASEHGLQYDTLPKFLIFESGIPSEFQGNLGDPEKVVEWFLKEVSSEDIEVISSVDSLNKIISSNLPLLALFTEEKLFQGESVIKETTIKLGIGLVRVSDVITSKKKYGLDSIPAVIYFQNGIPSIYDGPPLGGPNLYEWIEEQRTSSQIEKVSEEILQSLAAQKEYLAVFFTGPCSAKAQTDHECSEALVELEKIDDELDDFGITLVSTEDIVYPGSVLRLKAFPTLGIYVNGHFKSYTGSFKDRKLILTWLTDQETLTLPGRIEQVGSKMLKKLVEEEEDIIVFLYIKSEKSSNDALKVLEKADDLLEKYSIDFVKCSEESIEEYFGFENVPVLLYLENGVPTEFDGEIKDSLEIYKWALENYETNEIPSVHSPSVLSSCINRLDNIFVIFYDANKRKHNKAIEELEDIDDDSEKVGVFMIKISDPSIAKEYGLYVLPSGLYFEDGIPNIYDGEFTSTEVLHWIHENKAESKVEKVNSALIDDMISNQNYLAIVLLENCEKVDCSGIIDELEKIDSSLDDLDIDLVYTDDSDFTEKSLSLPALWFYRNGGDKLIFEGNVKNEMSVFKFLTQESSLLLPGKIEKVGIPLLNFFLKRSQSLFVYFYKENQQKSKKILNKLEEVDDMLDVVFLKCSDTDVDEEYGLGYLPRLVHFLNKVPFVFPGDEANAKEVSDWMVQRIEDLSIRFVTKPMLESLIERESSVGVIFVDDEDKSQMKLINNIQNQINKFGNQILVLVDDAGWAENLGLSSLPTLVHFSGPIPSVYKGEESVRDIVHWLDVQNSEFVVKEVTSKILKDLIYSEEYLGVLFKNPSCTGDCLQLYSELDSVDSKIGALGITLVQCDDEDFAREHLDISFIPAIALFRNERILLYDSSKSDVLGWFSDPLNWEVESTIEKVNEVMLNHIYETNNDFVVLFYDENDRDSDELLDSIKFLDDKLNGSSFIRVSEKGAEESFGILGIPALAYIQNGIPSVYELEGIEDYKYIENRILVLKESIGISDITSVLLDTLMKKFTHLAVVFYDMEDDPTLIKLEKVAEKCAQNEIALVKLNDPNESIKYGLESFPSLIYFKSSLPSIMTSVSIEKPKDVFEWLLKMSRSTVIEFVSDEILRELYQSREYVAVLFQGNEECSEILAELEAIDDELDDTGILMVTTKDEVVAAEQGIEDFPKLGFFRNGHFIEYDGSITDDKRIIHKWLTNEDTLKIAGVIDEVNSAMLLNILQDEKYAFVFFYHANDTSTLPILEGLETIDEKLDQQDLTMVKISEYGSGKQYGIQRDPVLVFFENGIPEMYENSLLNENQVMNWITSELNEQSISEITVSMLNKLVEKDNTIAVIFYDSGDNEDYTILKEVQKIKTDCEKYGINIVKINDAKESKRYGLDTLPGLLYFEKRIPTVYDEELEHEDVLLDWLIQQKMTDTILKVTDEILGPLIQEKEYLLVYFSGPCEEDDPCTEHLNGLEEIDGHLRDIGITTLTTEERELAKSLDIRKFPSLVLFKNSGEFSVYEKELESEMNVLEWASDKSTLQVIGSIEKVNLQILKYFQKIYPDVILYLYRASHSLDELILKKLETIDDDLDEKNVPLIKISDTGIDRALGLSGQGFPLLIHFNEKVPCLFKGNLQDSDPEKILKWIEESMQKSEIEVVSDSVLDYLIISLDDFAVIFTDDNSAPFMEGMEQMDDELDSIGIPLVRIKDKSKALELGIESFPTIIYFKNQLPGLYDGDYSDFDSIFSWLNERRKNSCLYLVSDNILEDLLHSQEYLIVFFQGSCKSNDNECFSRLKKNLRTLNDISDEVQNIGIPLVTLKNKKYPKTTFGITGFPALVLFKNGGHMTLYAGQLKDETAILNWILNADNLGILDSIEEVNDKLLFHIIDSEENVLVFFYEEEAPDSTEEYEEVFNKINIQFEEDDLKFVKISDKYQSVNDYGLSIVPSLVYFENGVPSVYYGDMLTFEEISKWITRALKTSEITEVNSLILDSLIERKEYLAVLYYDPSKDDSVLEACETTDDDLRDHDVLYVKISDEKAIENLGIKAPSLVYYENRVPHLYSQGVLGTHPSEDSDWIIKQRNLATIEYVTKDMLENLIEEEEYVVVLFLGTCSEEEDQCDKIMNELEQIDQILDEYGILFVYSDDLEKPQEHWISRLPALAFYRNGDYLKYPGTDLTKEESVLTWLTSTKTLNLPGLIEEVNSLMLNKLLLSGNTFVFFYSKTDVFARKILIFLEELDTEIGSKGAHFVKISDIGIDKDFELEDLPTLAYFKKSRSPIIFQGDLRSSELVNEWVFAQIVSENKKTKLKRKSKK